MTTDEARILDAWNDGGLQPWYQELVKARLCSQWPALAAAIQTLQINAQHAAEPTFADRMAARSLAAVQAKYPSPVPPEETPDAA